PGLPGVQPRIVGAPDRSRLLHGQSGCARPRTLQAGRSLVGPQRRRWLACQASPSDQSEIPSRAKSLIRNCPGFPERAGKPPALDSQTPGVVNRKLRVVRNIPTARALPSAEARGTSGRAAMRIAVATSTTPSTAEKPRTLMNPYTQFISGLLATNGRIPSAS